jgi:hypothetical protein
MIKIFPLETVILAEKPQKLVDWYITVLGLMKQGIMKMIIFIII